MGTIDEALRRLVAEASDGKDVLIGGTPGQARQLMAEAAVALANRATVVSVASPIGELSVSALLAQLAGRLDLDNQDDAVLELGFRRLTGDGRTVLMVHAPGGISQSAMRYVQHVSTHAPRLSLVFYNTPSLGLLMLAEPRLETLRARLYASPVIEFEAPAIAWPTRPVTVAAGDSDEDLFTYPFREAETGTRPRRPTLWAASALGFVATVGVLWFMQSGPDTAVAGSRTVSDDVPIAPAIVPQPRLAALPDTAAVNPPQAGGALPAAPSPPAMPPPVATDLAPVARDEVPAQPPSGTPPHPETVVSALPPLQPKAEHRARRPERREASHVTRVRPYGLPPRWQEPSEYESDPPWDDGISPLWVRRDQRRGSPHPSPYGYPYGPRAFDDP